MKRLLSCLAVAGFLLAPAAWAAEDEEVPLFMRGKADDGPKVEKPEDFEYDDWLADQINNTCAGCHGPYGQGGGDGTYPRLAGLPVEYIVRQIKLFKSRERENIPMVPYANDRELPKDDVWQIATFLNRIDLATHLPPQNPDDPMDGLKRLEQAKKVLQIPRAPGDVEKGKRAYQEDCALCHGRDGYGKRETPQLAGQWINYLWTQIDNFVEGERDHEDTDLLFEGQRERLKNIFAYLSTLDD